jgi:predicted O-methyltransferase YrrM
MVFRHRLPTKASGGGRLDKLSPRLFPAAREAALKARQNPGWLKEHEGRLLFCLAANLPQPDAVVEIGSAEGKSTIWLASGLKASGRGGRVFAVDPHEAYLGRSNTQEEFERNMRAAGVSEFVVGIGERSEEAAKGWGAPLKLIFIDGDHSYDAVRRDFELWEKHLVPGGVVAFHDCLRPRTGPTRVFLEEVVCSRRFSQVALVGSIGYGQKGCGQEAGGLGLSESLLGRRYVEASLRLFLFGAARVRAKPLLNFLRALVPH